MGMGGSALAWLGRQGSWAVAALVVVGVAFPPLGRVLRPALPEAVGLLLTLALLRADASALRGHLRRPGLIAAATLWTGVAVPALFGAGAWLAGLRTSDPGLFLGLMMQGLASPLTGGPALAVFMGLDATLVLVALVTGTALLPLTAPVLAHWLVGDVLAVSPGSLGVRLGLTLAGAALLAGLMRRVCGEAAIRRYGDVVGGLNVVVLLVFISAVMGDVGPMAWADPRRVAGLTGLAFAVSAALLLVTALLFRRAGRMDALALGVTASLRNTGLMVAALDGALPPTAWLYFALSQLPIYLAPLLLPPLFRALPAAGYRPATPPMPPPG